MSEELYLREEKGEMPIHSKPNRHELLSLITQQRQEIHLLNAANNINIAMREELFKELAAAKETIETLRRKAAALDAIAKYKHCDVVANIIANAMEGK